MKSHSPFKIRIPVLTTALLTAMASTGLAIDYTWTNGGANMTWDTASGNWDTGSGNTPWVDNNTAVLGTAGAGAITVSGTRIVEGLTTSANGYTLTGGAIQLGLANTQFTINNDLTISSALIGGANGLTKAGNATLTLSGGLANAFTGPIVVSAGAMASDNGASLKNVTGSITVASGATFDAQQGFDANTIGNAFFLSGTGSGILNHGALNIRENATLTGTITLNADSKITHDWNNATINGNIVGTNRNLQLATLQSSQGGITVNGSVQLGTGALTLTGIGTTLAPDFTITGSNSYSGGTVLQGGSVSISGTNALGTGAIAFSANSTLLTGFTGTMANAVTIASGVNGGFNTAVGTTLRLNGALTGAGSLVKTGTGTLALGGGLANTLSGTISVNAGQLTTMNGASVRNVTGPIVVAAGATFDANQNFDANNFAQNIFLSGTGSGISGRGALNLRSNATWTGTITLNDDAKITHDFNLATINGPIVGVNKNLHLATLTTGQPGFVINGPIQLGTGGVTIQGIGTTTADVTLTGNNTYTGATTITSGSLALSGAGALADTSAVNLTGASSVFGITGITASGETVGSLAGVNGSSVRLGAKNLTVGGNDTNTTFSGILSGSGGSLTKEGSGTMILGGANTYTGATIIAEGTLLLNGTGSIASTQVEFGVTDSSAGLLTLENTAFSFSNSLHLDLGAVTATTASWTLFNGSAFGAGDLNLSGLTSDIGSLTFVDNSGIWTGTDGSGRTWTFDEDLGQLSVVPEPGVWGLVAAGLAVTMGLRRRRPLAR